MTTPQENPTCNECGLETFKLIGGVCMSCHEPQEKKAELILPEIYKECAHPQSVWFEEHWRPVFNQLQSENQRLKEENEKYKLEAAFWPQYYNPANTSFKSMIDAFVTLPKDKQDKLINLAKTLKEMSE